MGIGPGPECNFNSLDLSNIVAPSSVDPGANEVYFNAVSGDLYPSQLGPDDFATIELDFSLSRETIANLVVHRIKSDTSSTANGPPSCLQFEEISQ